MIPPITREEKYMYEIVGAGKTAPEKPLTRKEIFYAVILGEDRTIPRPITNAEKYLATLAGAYSEALPFPTTRIEKFLAKAAGMDVETPVPVTREEIFWDNYSAVQKFEGVPPLTFKSNGKALKNYRIYGNTVDGESVGDLMAEGEHAGKYRVPVTVEGKNLAPWDKKWTINVNGLITANNTSYSSIIDVHNIDYIYLFGNVNKLNSSIYRIGKSNILPEIGVNTIRITSTGGLVNVSDCNYCLVACQIYGTSTTHQDLLNEFMVTSGDSVPTKFEPYHEPITTNLYLPEPLKMVEDEAEYVDYEEQKQYFADGSYANVTLPEIPTIAGTNTLSVDTQVQPSKVYVEVGIKTGGYTIYFYNGETLLETVTGVPSGGTATYTGATPTSSQAGYIFDGWNPSNTNITADTSCYAQFK